MIPDDLSKLLLEFKNILINFLTINEHWSEVSSITYHQEQENIIQLYLNELIMYDSIIELLKGKYNFSALCILRTLFEDFFHFWLMIDGENYIITDDYQINPNEGSTKEEAVNNTYIQWNQSFKSGNHPDVLDIKKNPKKGKISIVRKNRGLFTKLNNRWGNPDLLGFQNKLQNRCVIQENCYPSQMQRYNLDNVTICLLLFVGEMDASTLGEGSSCKIEEYSLEEFIPILLKTNPCWDYENHNNVFINNKFSNLWTFYKITIDSYIDYR